jgi:hypothetical protein
LRIILFGGRVIVLKRANKAYMPFQYFANAFGYNEFVQIMITNYYIYIVA